MHSHSLSHVDTLVNHTECKGKLSDSSPIIRILQILRQQYLRTANISAVSRPISECEVISVEYKIRRRWIIYISIIQCV